MEGKTKKRIIFATIFLLLVLIGKRINFSPLVGAESQYFTFFQFFGPIPTAFIGSFFGVIAVFGAELADFLISGTAPELVNLLRLLPMLFAAYYFGSKKKKFGVTVPLLAFIMFIAHPTGRAAIPYALYWIIPLVVALIPRLKKNLYLKSLGTTFTAHAVGSVFWVYFVPMPAEAYIALIPIVAVERLLFAAGISVSYLAINAALDIVSDKWKIPDGVLHVNKKLSLSKLFH